MASIRRKVEEIGTGPDENMIADSLAVEARRARAAGRQFPRFLWLALALAGCQSGSHSAYVAPRVTGRVLDADTGQPLPGVAVTRLAAGQKRTSDGSVKGGQVELQLHPVRSDANGWFELASKRTLTLLPRAGWWSVTICFEKSGFESFYTNYTLAQVYSNAPSGEPLVNGGDIRLRPERE